MNWHDYAARIDRVRDDLFISGYSGAMTAGEEPGWHIITVAEEFVGMIDNHSELPLIFPDESASPAAALESNRITLREIRDVYERVRQDGTKVLIHCAAGVERSAAAVCYILSDGDPEEPAMTAAYETLVKVRPEVYLKSIIMLSSGTWPHERTG